MGSSVARKQLFSLHFKEEHVRMDFKRIHYNIVEAKHKVTSLSKQKKFVQLKSDVVSEWEEVYLGAIAEEEEEKPSPKQPSVRRFLEEQEEKRKQEEEKKKEAEEEKHRDQILNCLESMNKLLMVEVQLKRAEQRLRECYNNEIELKSHLSEANNLLKKIDKAFEEK